MSTCLDVLIEGTVTCFPVPVPARKGHRSYRWMHSSSPGPLGEGHKARASSPEQVHLWGLERALGSSRWVDLGQGESHWNLGPRWRGLPNSGRLTPVPSHQEAGLKLLALLMNKTARF